MIAAHCDECSPSWSTTIRTARARTSGENLLLVCFVMAPPSQELEPPINPGRFMRLLSEGEIAVATKIGLLHCRIFGQCSGDSEFLLRPVDVRDAVARWRLDEPTQPHARAEDVLGVTGLV